MKFNKTHPLTRNGLIVGQQVSHIGITYTVMDEDYHSYDLEPDEPIKLWKGQRVY